jgi:hypothetical protein
MLNMNISNFEDLLQASRQQAQPQRLLFVFVGADLPDDATPAQRASFEAGQGGALVPVMCVDKSPDEIENFAALVHEASQFGVTWSMVFVAGMSGTAGQPPTTEAAEKPLQRMVESIKAGSLGSYLPFDTTGLPVVLS